MNFEIFNYVLISSNSQSVYCALKIRKKHSSWAEINTNLTDWKNKPIIFIIYIYEKVQI